MHLDFPHDIYWNNIDLFYKCSCEHLASTCSANIMPEIICRNAGLVHKSMKICDYIRCGAMGALRWKRCHAKYCALLLDGLELGEGCLEIITGSVAVRMYLAQQIACSSNV